jgi:hypothetical protein
MCLAAAAAAAAAAAVSWLEASFKFARIVFELLANKSSSSFFRVHVIDGSFSD